MANKENFKLFVKKNPKLIEYVRNGESTWQKFYEIFDLYGEENKAWEDYLGNKEQVKVGASSAATAASVAGIGEIFNWLKGINLDSVQNGVGSLQRVVGLLQDFSKKENKDEPPKEEYKPRPIYKHFED